MTTDTNTNQPTTTPTAALNQIFQELTKSDVTPIWDVLEIPYSIRVSRSNPDYTFFDYQIDVLAKAARKHSARCQCEPCAAVKPMKWKRVSKTLTIHVPYVDVTREETFTAHLSLSGKTYNEFSEPLPDPGYQLRREFMGALVSSRLPGADPLFMRLYILAKDQQRSAALRVRETSLPPSLIQLVENYHSPLSEDFSPADEVIDTTLPEAVATAKSQGDYFRDLSANYSRYATGQAPWPARPESLVVDSLHGSVVSVLSEAAD